MLPQRQVTSSAPGTRTWPRSPATPVAPRWSRPPEMMPEPMPVATLISTRSSTSVRCTCCSPSAMMLTSLSTRTGTAYSRWRRPGTSYLSQPGMIGGLIGRPVACSTGPGRPMPIAARCLTGRRCAFSSARTVVDTQPRTTSGPSAMSRLALTSPRMSPERSAIAARTWVAPTSTPTTTLAAGLSAKSAGGRPPVERAPPNGATSSRRMSTSIRAAMVDRARPVASASSARVQGRPSRSSSKMSPACTASSEAPTTSAV